MFVYLFMKVLVLIHSLQFELLATKWGYWYLVEVIGFVFVPMMLLIIGGKNRNSKMLLTGAIMSALGFILNRLNISVITFKWYAPVHYVPSWIEIVITLAIVFAEIWAFRWVAHRMPVFQAPPLWAKKQDMGLDTEEEKLDIKDKQLA